VEVQPCLNLWLDIDGRSCLVSDDLPCFDERVCLDVLATSEKLDSTRMKLY